MSHNTTSFGRRPRSDGGWIVSSQSRRRDRHRLRPGLLELEERRLLATFTVTSTADDGSPGTLRSAIEAANASPGANTIDFDATVFSEPQTITLVGNQLELSNTSGTQTITGPAADVTVSGGGHTGVLEVESGVTTSITGLTLTGGQMHGNGGALYNLGSTTLNTCTVSGNTAAGSSGGGLFNSGVASLINCTVSGNVASNGGGLENDKGTVTLTGCAINLNKASGYYGGGMENSGSVTMDNTTLSGNTASDSGGGLFNRGPGTAYLTRCAIGSNVAEYNGGLANNGNAELVGCTVTSNTGWHGNGGVGNDNSLDLVDTILSGNVGGIGAGGLNEARGKAELTDCTISGNTASIGAGIDVGAYGRVYLTGCTISGNSASSKAAGLFSAGYAADLTDCTISGNSAPGNGGGLYNSGTMALTACTISANSANNGGGLFVTFTAALTDTIVAGNTLPNSSLPSDVGGPSNISGSDNLFGPGGSGGLQPGSNGNIILGPSSPTGLAPLSYFGGPTQTMALLPGSEAIGNGRAVSGVTTDQRGEPLDTPLPDIGSFQVQKELVVNTASDATSSPLGYLSLRQAISLANVMEAAQAITFDSTVFGTAQTITLTQGQLELSDTGGTVSITGPVAGVTISGGGASRVLQVDSGVTDSISNLTISGGTVKGYGGGLYNDGTTTLNDVTVSDNSAATGGGIWNDGTATLTNCTVSGNSASTEGGGLGNAAGGTVMLTNCTLSGNYGTSAYGGIDLAAAATLNDTIVVGNTDSSGASDVGGPGMASGTYNLIGTGGSGGLINGLDGNMIGVANPGLAPLGAYGGPTDTMALLPGSVAIAAGEALSDIAADQRGAPRPTSGAIDIGAFQDQGYTVAVASGTPQSTLVNQAFNAPLVALLTEDYVQSPLPGVTIGFSAPSSGPSATLSAGSAVTNVSGMASVTATANANDGAYAVTAAASGVTSSASFDLTNQVQPSITGLQSPTITYGTTVTFTGTLAAGSQYPPAGEEVVAVTVDGVTNDAEIESDGSFSTQFTSSHGFLDAASTAYIVTCVYAGDGIFLASDGSSQLTVNPEALTVTAVANTKVYDGTTIAIAVPMITSGSLASGDSPDFAETYSDKNVGTGLTLTPSGTVDDGNGGQNYFYTFVPMSNGVITPAALTITATSDTKVYDGTTASSKTPTYGTLYGGDTLTGPTQAFSSKNVLGADGSTLKVTGYTVDDGDGGADYTVTTQTAAGTITPAALEITAASDTKVYDGTTASSRSPTYGKLYDGDSLTGLTQAFTSKNVLGTNGSTLTVTGYTVDDGDNGNDYKVTTHNAAGSITPAALTITATSDTKVYDATTSSSQYPTCGTLYASDTVSALTQVFTSKNVLGAGGSTLIVTGYKVNDGDSGNDYTVKTDNAVGSITPAPLTITATSDSKVYDGTTTSSKTPTSGTLYANDRVTGLTQAFISKNVRGADGSTLTVTAYTINDGDSGKDYTVNTQTAPGTITPAPLTVRANNVSTVYGSRLPALTYTISGFVSGDSSTVVSGAPMITTTAASRANAGAYSIAIAAGTLSATNYDFPTSNLITGTLTVTPAPLVITAVSTSTITGHPEPALTAVYAGFVNGDTPASLTSPAVLYSPASPSSAPGYYPITVGGANSPNYAIHYVAGTLTVDPALATVTSIAVEKLKKGKKSTEYIVVQFSEALDMGAALNIHNYRLVTVPKSNKQKGKPVTLASASYSASAFTVTLTTRKALVLSPPLNLTISQTGLLDALDRPLSATYVATLKKVGTQVTPTVPLARPQATSAEVVDAVLAAGISGGGNSSRASSRD